MWIVYSIVNQVNFKAYIGQHHGYDLNKRWNRTLSNCKNNSHLKAAITKYGYQAFQRHILTYASCQQEADLLEQFFILICQSTNPEFGYNQLAGGIIWRGSHTPKTKQKLSEAMKQVWLIRSRQEQASAIRRWWRTRTDAERQELRRKISQSRRGQKLHKVTPPWNKGLIGLPSARKGKKYGPQKHPCTAYPPQTTQHKRRIGESVRKFWAKKRETRKKISDGLKRYWAKKREFSKKKPVAGTKYQRRQNTNNTYRREEECTSLKKKDWHQRSRAQVLRAKAG